MTTKEFIQLLYTNQELCEKLSACKDETAAYSIAQEQGVTDDLDTFKNEMYALYQDIGELSEDELENVSAAGNTTGIIISTALSGSVVVSAVVAETASAAAGAFL